MNGSDAQRIVTGTVPDAEAFADAANGPDGRRPVSDLPGGGAGQSRIQPVPEARISRPEAPARGPEASSWGG